MKGKDLTERVYKRIKRDLMLSRIPAGELFSEQQLADRYECSRTPAREAAGQLVMEGFLNKYPSKGYIVRLPTQKEMREMRYCCYTLEKAALELTIHTAYGEEISNLYDLIDQKEQDEESAFFSNLIFHCELARLSGNESMVQLIETLHYKMLRGEAQPLENPYDYLGERRQAIISREDHNNHRAIVDALMERDVKKAQEALRGDFYPSTIETGSQQKEG